MAEAYVSYVASTIRSKGQQGYHIFTGENTRYVARGYLYPMWGITPRVEVDLDKERGKGMRITEFLSLDGGNITRPKLNFSPTHTPSKRGKN